MTYNTKVFEPLTLSRAKDVVLTPDPSFPNKFVDETNFLVDFIKTNILIEPTTKILDFGCGMGRVSKRLIEEFNCKVVGVDFSLQMQTHAITYVDSDNFDAVSEYDQSDIDIAIASWVLQHVEFPTTEIERIHHNLKPSAFFVMVNEPIRYVPIGIDSNGFVKWFDDGIDIFGLVSQYFNLIGTYDYPMTNKKPLSLWTKK